MKEYGWFVLLMILLLAGCGGGTSSGTGNTGTPPTPSPIPTTTYSVSGSITPVQPGINIHLKSASTDNTVPTAADGTYLFSGIVNGQYTVTPDLAGYIFNPINRTITITDSNVAGVDFSDNLAVYTLSGAITPALANVTINVSGATTASTVTASDGTYTLNNLISDTYTVTPSLTGYTFSPVNRSVPVTSVNAQGVNFSATLIPVGYRISGVITQNQLALPGVSMTLSGASKASYVTDANGKFNFNGLANGNYTLTPTPQSGLSFTPTSLPVTLTNADAPNQNFTAIATSPARNFTLYIKSGTLTINGNGGTTLAAWGYTDTASGVAKFPGPQLNVNAGENVSVTVVNNHTLAHNFVIKGVTTDLTPIPAGASRTYQFTVATSGTSIYYDSLNNDINREMGLYGAMVVAPTDGSQHLWAGGPAYDFQRVWVVGDMDKPRWNDLAAAGTAVNTAVYKPNYFIIDGEGGFDGMQDPNVTINGNVGQYALVRIANGGQFTHSLHFHSNHVTVLAKNGVKEISPKDMDVVALPPLETVDVLFYLNQVGNYPMHVHTAQLETANGVYLNGVATMISIH